MSEEKTVLTVAVVALVWYWWKHRGGPGGIGTGNNNAGSCPAGHVCGGVTKYDGYWPGGWN